MIAAAAVLPSAPLLVPGVSASLPVGVSAVLDAVDAAVEQLPDADVTVLLAADEAAPAVYRDGQATLAGVGRPDIRAQLRVPELAGALAAAVDWPLRAGGPLPLGLTVLAMLLGGGPVVPVAVPPDADFDELAALGGRIGRAAGGDTRTVIVAAGDLSAGLTERSPLYRVDGARDWDERVVGMVDSGRWDGLAQLGPDEARRVGALGWAPLSVLHGVCSQAKVGLVLRHYSAPRGVGYLVAHGA